MTTGNTIVNKALELLDGALRSSGIVILAPPTTRKQIDAPYFVQGGGRPTSASRRADIDALACILRHHIRNILRLIAKRAGRRRVTNPKSMRKQRNARKPDPGNRSRT